MKHQQVVVDYWTMVKTSLTYLALVVSVFVLFRMTYAVFMLPRAMRRSQEQLSKRLLELQERMGEKAAEELSAEGLDEAKAITGADKEGDDKKKEGANAVEGVKVGEAVEEVKKQL